MRRTGRFGEHGGYYVSELILPCLEELEAAWLDAQDDPSYRAELSRLLAEFAGRPTPLGPAPALSRRVGAPVLLKREDLLHGGAHKTNNAIGQALLARRMGKPTLIAETGAGQHGVATAMAGARLGLSVKVFMGKKDVERQRPNVQRMRLFGAEVVPVELGGQGLEDAINEAMRYWTANLEDTFYVFGTAAGPHPYPSIVRDLQRVIGDEIQAQCKQAYGRSPSAVIACIGGGSNAIGAFAPFLDDPSVRLFGAEAGGFGAGPGAHGATLTRGRAGCLHGSMSYVLQDVDGQVQRSHSVSAGLDYPGVGPQHAHLAATGRVSYHAVSDRDALDAFGLLCREEGILPALETAHAVALALALPFAPEDLVVVNLSGRGDKDLEHVAALERGAP